MLEQVDNIAQPVAAEVATTDYELTVADGATIMARSTTFPTSDSRAADMYLHGSRFRGTQLVRRVFLDVPAEVGQFAPGQQLQPRRLRVAQPGSATISSTPAAEHRPSRYVLPWSVTIVVTASSSQTRAKSAAPSLL